MIVTLLLGSLVLLFSLFSKYSKKHVYVKISFLIIFLYLALRYQFGYDYINYFYHFNLISDAYSSIVDKTSDDDFEFLWVFLNRVFSVLNYYWMIAFIAAFNSVVYYKFVTKYVDSYNYYIALFVYVFLPILMLTQLSAMRQHVAILFFIIAYTGIVNHKFFNYIIYWGIAVGFHSSSLFLLPFYFINRVKTRYLAVFVAAAFILLLVFDSYIAIFVKSIIFLCFDNYASYLDDNSVAIPLVGTLYRLSVVAIIYFISAKSLVKFESRNTTALNMSLVALLLDQCVQIIPFVGRLTMYFDVFYMLSFPLIISSIRNYLFKFVFLVVVVVYFLFLFCVFFNSELSDAYQNYKTILEI